jgi:hypothetical protein
VPDRNLHRLPIDVWVSDRRQPDLAELTGPAADYAQRYEQARESDALTARAEALWGLVARGGESLAWCRSRLESGDPVSIGDACGVLAWVGTPPDLVPPLRRLLTQLPDGEARDCVYALLPESARGENDAVAEQGPPDEDLLGGSMAPFTSVIWYVEAPLEATIRRRQKEPVGPPPYRYQPTGPIDWLNAKLQVALRRPDPLNPNSPVKTHDTRLRAPLPQLLTRLEPFAMPSWKSLWVRTDSDWTAVFSQGSDLSWVAGLARRLKTRVLRTSYHPDVRRGKQIVSHGGCAFWLYDGTREDLAPLYGLRSIQASRQSGWSWDEHGEVQPFEETERYSARRIAQRFDLPMLNRYCAALGIRRADPDFYGPDALLEELSRKRWKREPRMMSSAEWRAEHQTSS